MKQRSCVVCGHDITGRWPAQTCSGLCRELAYREGRKRTARHRNPGYLARKRARDRIRDRAKTEARRKVREANPAWQAQRAAIEQRKREKEERRARRIEKRKAKEARRCRPRYCIVCGHDITGRWPAQTCSGLCREIAQRNARRRHDRHRNPAHLARKAARKAARVAERYRSDPAWVAKKRAYSRAWFRAKREADPAWQAWRIGVEERKREREAQRERACQRRQQRECEPKKEKKEKAKRFCVVCGVDITHRPSGQAVTCCKAHYAEYRLHYNRRRRIQRTMQLGFREHERQRHANDIHAKHSVIIQALRDLGWVRQHTLDVITDPSQPQPFNTPSLPRFQRVSVNAMERTTRRLRHAATVHELRGQTIFVDRSGNAFLGITNQDEFNRGRISRWNAIHRPSKKRFNIHRPINFKPTVRAAKHLEYQHTHLEARQGQDRRRRQKKRDLIAALEKLGWVRNGQLTDVPLSNQGADVDR